MAGQNADSRGGRERGDATLPSAPPEVDLFREPGDDDDAPRDRRDARHEAEGERTTPRVRPACTIAVGGSKGGVGTSVVAANLALYLASIGRRVLLVDADPGGANLHTLVGAPSPTRPRADNRAVGRPVDTQIQGLRLLWGALDEGLRGRRGGGRRKLARAVESAEADYVVLDLGKCTSRGGIDALLSADLSLILTLPEPTALESAYRFVRRAFLRYLHRSVIDQPTRLALMQKARELGGAPAPLDLWRTLEDDGDPLAEVVRDAMERFHPNLVISQTRLRADLELGDQVRSAARRRLGIGIEYLGHVEYDDTVWSCVRARRLLLIESPGTKASKNVEKIARRLLALQTGKRKPPARTVPPESHHDLLEVDRGATDEEVRRAFKRVRDIYAEDALACYSLFEPHELEVLRARLEEAYDVLLDPVRRKPYELSVFPPSEEHEEPVPARMSHNEPLPPPPELTPDTDYTGALLRAVRESQGISLRDVSARTKVGLPYLEAIEGDAFDALPAPVYVRGFVTEIAKALKLDAAQVARTYVRRYRRHLEERGKSA
ncbi:helix-turn-helix domain-containing protein [Sandaracinus amylolyticus]|uniref:Flagellar synthesis regulator FleN n=1 Tax=Sandaracinus amylolyticus TaxID=927083 RepID=A0A0F6YL44_9BACT|nr:helix-turn-helix domain-containing protein [Sandaracinus amylolyticus]AKF07878.1 Flagellar synthesis regulator FleN [Sandaracinus amylolyticus]